MKKIKATLLITVSARWFSEGSGAELLKGWVEDDLTSEGYTVHSVEVFEEAAEVKFVSEL